MSKEKQVALVPFVQRDPDRSDVFIEPVDMSLGPLAAGRAVLGKFIAEELNSLEDVEAAVGDLETWCVDQVLLPVGHTRTHWEAYDAAALVRGTLKAV